MKDFIELEKSKSDRTIHSVFTPKEIVWIIQEHFNEQRRFHDYSYSEILLLWDCLNDLIWKFKDD